jgi:nucleoid-associated protein YgaU
LETYGEGKIKIEIKFIAKDENNILTPLTISREYDGLSSMRGVDVEWSQNSGFAALNNVEKIRVWKQHHDNFVLMHDYSVDFGVGPNVYSYTVRSGDTWETIAESLYGDLHLADKLRYALA